MQGLWFDPEIFPDCPVLIKLLQIRGGIHDGEKAGYASGMRKRENLKELEAGEAQVEGTLRE